MRDNVFPLTPEEMRSALRNIRDCVWPSGDESHEWDSGTIDDVVAVLRDYGITPRKRGKRDTLG